MEQHKHDSLLDPIDRTIQWEYIGFRELLKKLYNDINIDPEPFKDCIGQDLLEGDTVIYSDKDWGPRPGIVVKIEDNGEFCAVSYLGNGKDCQNSIGDIICRDLVYKCLKVTNEDVIKLYKK